MIEDVKNDKLDIDDAMHQLRDLPFENIGYANIDYHRSLRNGYLEVIYCDGKTDEHIVGIVERIYDVGVAGIHRLLNCRAIIESARVIVAVADMEGALPSVVGGLVDIPIIAVPTSVGYGANFDGLVALLAMLSSCASGISVVNIDNGFGAGYLASTINKIK